VQESPLAEQRELGNNLAERKVRSAWSGKATGRDSVTATISMRMDFLVGTVYSGISGGNRLYTKGARIERFPFIQTAE